MKSENVGCLLQRRQLDIHEDGKIRAEQGEIMLVVRLQIPELYLGRLLAMDRDKRRTKRVNLAKFPYSRLGTGFLYRNGFCQDRDSRLDFPAFADCDDLHG